MCDEIPDSKTLGDFLRVLGGESPNDGDSECHGIVANTLVLHDAVATCTLEDAINLAEEAMRPSPMLWSLSHQGYKLSKVWWMADYNR
jgi:hypothetical protein